MAPAAYGGLGSSLGPAPPPSPPPLSPQSDRGRPAAPRATLAPFGCLAAVGVSLAAFAAAARKGPDSATVTPVGKARRRDGGAVEFLSVGDWGDSQVLGVAAQMGRHSPAFVLALGDNFYDVGLHTTEDTAAVDAQFDERFESTFRAPALRSAPWFVCAGNHDYYGGAAAISAEIEYSKRSSRWVYPDVYYNRTYTDPHSGMQILIAAVDTWRLNGGDTYVSWHHGRHHLRSAAVVQDHFAHGKLSRVTHDHLLRTFAVDVSAKATAAAEGCADEQQLRWLRTVLAESRAHWKLVIGHFGVRSCALHEHGDTPALVEHLEPVLRRYGADAYFSGHDHILQHIERGDVHYFGSGAGARRHFGADRSYRGLLGAADGTRDHLRTSFHDERGRRLYTHTLAKRRSGAVSTSV
eukprot:TRINITY_DN6891_c0_g1_i1.p1 TRINITY_DN6891_c0_g1~~TRINITY_DN6891_c0_g1_i1.p1  ORF type:complete len:433 (+),score=108.25 TRINITY_DN6891_c0_g1_i1:74-1300(+)